MNSKLLAIFLIALFAVATSEIERGTKNFWSLVYKSDALPSLHLLCHVSCIACGWPKQGQAYFSTVDRAVFVNQIVIKYLNETNRIKIFQNWNHAFLETTYHVKHRMNIVIIIARNPSSWADFALRRKQSVNGVGANKIWNHLFYSFIS